MIDVFSLIVGVFIGYIIRSLIPVCKRFKKFMAEEKKQKGESKL